MLAATFDSNDFAIQMNMTYGSLYNKLKQYANMGVTKYIRYVRLKEAAKQLAKSSKSVSEICYEVGFNDTKYFRDSFKDLFGVSPSEYVKAYRKSDENS